MLEAQTVGSQPCAARKLGFVLRPGVSLQDQCRGWDYLEVLLSLI
jgi:hypothetical protein